MSWSENIRKAALYLEHNMENTMNSVGISGLAAYLPPYRTNLEDWCGWTDGSWEKLRDVVGHSFRMRGHHQNVYTMAANAVLRLIKQYNIDPRTVGFFAFGTESSTDNSAGAVIVKGIVDKGLKKLGLPALSRNCEVPEYKHACLGGVYALKGAARFLACDGAQSKAIVVAADIAEYERGSTGEPTQGAGAVAMLLEAKPKLLEIKLQKSGSSADYRGPDFRKPFVRFAQQNASTNTQLRDFPVFNGYYSTNCYIDAVLLALNNMFNKCGLDRAEYLKQLGAIFLHRPYARMPETGLAISYLFALALGKAEDHAELKEYCDAARVKFHDVIEEFNAARNLFDLVEQGKMNSPVFPKAMRTIRVLPRFESFKRIQEKMALGSELMKNVGNLYSAALPAWIAAGLEDAQQSGVDLTGQEILTLGYGSGDAAEAIPMQVVEGWQEHAKKIRFASAFEGAVDLSENQYIALHSGRQPVDLPMDTEGEFFISRIGKNSGGDFDEDGIEYYGFGASANTKSGEKSDKSQKNNDSFNQVTNEV
ncbi:hydroxymethylglutaryl-CoA synthase [Teredinibacter turnerae]|uniref:hydroxymethylglutaryl-CoA synthase n=1 Tax=Teredinibacter turnerae TaxID=2426 RepID=UPI0003606D6D|nr:hydroxymethylglutaryl-CoA synthase [Teredinibacter turnerae]